MKKDLLSTSGMHDGACAQIFDYARILRIKMTSPEKKLWEYIKGKKLRYKFRRQHPINTFILDFYCHELRLSIELDGNHHFEAEQKAKDNNKTEYLASVGISEIRFTNTEVARNIESVLMVIKKEIIRSNNLAQD